MKNWTGLTSARLFGVSLAVALAGCSASPTPPAGPATATPRAAESDSSSATLTVSGGAAGAAHATLLPSAAPGGTGTAGAGAVPQATLTPTSSTSDNSCATNGPSKKEGCPCRMGETAACWTGSVADRNVGMCHDGLQVCSGSAEFAAWGPCMGEQQTCGTDAGVPPPPDTECGCIPGSIIQCSEDCSVGIICSLTATKTCLPDKTWSTCREDTSVPVDLPGIQCRNMLHGCFGILTPDMPATSDGEIYVGDCSKQFTCGHAPPPVQPPPVEDSPN